MLTPATKNHRRRSRPLLVAFLTTITTTITLVSVSVSAAAAAAAASTTSTTHAGIQTHFGGVSFAGGMSYDSEHQTAYVTGQVGAHSCFVGVLKRAASSSTEQLQFLSKQIFDERAICQTIAFRRDATRPGNALLLSLSEEGGLLTNQREEGSRRAKHYGGLVAMSFTNDKDSDADNGGVSSEYAPDRSVLMYQTAAVTVPRSITHDPRHDNRVFVATMTSDSSDIEYRNALGTPHENDGLGLTTIPNLTPGGGLLKYGNNFAMTIESIRLAAPVEGGKDGQSSNASGPSTAEVQWRKPFGIERNTNSVKRSGVTVNQILARRHGPETKSVGVDHDGKEMDVNNNADNHDAHALYVVGSVLGTSPAFGHDTINESSNAHQNIAGFVTKLDSDTGNLLYSRRFVFDGSNSNGNGNSNGVDTASTTDPLVTATYIEAVCESTGGDEDEDAIYVVGSYARVVEVVNSQRRSLGKQPRKRKHLRKRKQSHKQARISTRSLQATTVNEDDIVEDDDDDDNFDGDNDDDDGNGVSAGIGQINEDDVVEDDDDDDNYAVADGASTNGNGDDMDIEAEFENDNDYNEIGNAQSSSNNDDIVEDDDDDNYAEEDDIVDDDDGAVDDVDDADGDADTDYSTDDAIVDDDSTDDDSTDGTDYSTDDAIVDDDATDDDSTDDAIVDDDSTDDSTDDAIVDDDSMDDAIVDDDATDDDANEDDIVDDDDAYGDDDDFGGPPTIVTPFVAKLRASTLETIWQIDFVSTTDARALGCGVAPNSKNTMYVAGLVENGGELVGRTTSLLGDDVLLMRLDTTDGNVKWIKQMGTSGDDRLAYGGGGLAVLEDDADGNSGGVLLMGDTTGHLYSVSNVDSEIFVVEVDADGNLPERTESSGIDYSSGAAKMKLSNPVNTNTNTNGGGAGGSGGGNTGGGKGLVIDDINNDLNNNDNNVIKKKDTNKKRERKPDTSPDQSDTNSELKPTSKTSLKLGRVLYVLMSISLFIVACAGLVYFCLSRRKREATGRALVFSYLQNFDLEDIDVKQAATGGWHGTYVGNLAFGLNVREDDMPSSDSFSSIRSDTSYGSTVSIDNDLVERKLSKLSHSSVVRDILFMDYDESIYGKGKSKKKKKKKSIVFEDEIVENGDGDDSHEQNRQAGVVQDPTLYDNAATAGAKDDDPWGSEII